jgi:hypothetical protein
MISLLFAQFCFIESLNVYHFFEVIKIFIAPFIKLYQLRDFHFFQNVIAVEFTASFSEITFS